MNYTKVSFQIPQEILASLHTSLEDLTKEIRFKAAITYFQEKRLSLGKAAEFAGIARLEFMDLLSKQGVTLFDYDESEVKEEMKNQVFFPKEGHDSK